MVKKAVFEGLVFDEAGNPVSVAYVGEEPCYVVNDAGFRRHIDAGQVDQQILDQMLKMIEGNEQVITEQAAQMLGQDDIFSKAAIAKQVRDIDKQFEMLKRSGIPEDARTYLGMMGFRIRINVHGEVLEVEQPGMIDPSDEG